MNVQFLGREKGQLPFIILTLTIILDKTTLNNFKPYFCKAIIDFLELSNVDHYFIALCYGEQVLKSDVRRSWNFNTSLDCRRLKVSKYLCFQDYYTYPSLFSNKEFLASYIDSYHSKLFIQLEAGF